MERYKEADLNQGLKLIAKSSAIIFIGLLFSKLSLYAYRILISRTYGAEIYGVFSLSVMLIGWFKVFSGLGLKQGLSRYIPFFRARKEDEKIQYIFKKSFLILIIISAIAGLLLFFLSDLIAIDIFSNSNLVIFLRIFSIALPLIVLGESLLSAIKSYEQIGWFSFISNVLGNLVMLMCLFLLIFFEADLISVPISYALGYSSMFFVAYIVCKKKIPKIFKLHRKSGIESGKIAFKEMFSYSWPFIFYGIVLLIFSWTDSLMLGIFRTAEEVGFYNAAMPFAALIEFPLIIFIQFFFPLVTKEFSKNRMDIVKQLSQQVGKWIFIMTIPIFIILFCFPGVFLKLFGEEYLVAESALRFLSVGVLFSTIFGISQELLSMKGKSKLILLDMVVAGAINVLLNFLLVPNYGISGASIATMVSLIFLSLTFFIQVYRNLSIIPLRRKVLRVSIIAVVATSLLFFIRSFMAINFVSLIFCGIFFMAIYILLLLVTGCFDKNDIYILRSILNKVGKNKI